MIYFLIFLSKIVENALSTLRLIIVSNGKKLMGAILQGIVVIVWVFSISITIINVNKDIFKIIFFVLGSIVGSYLGSVIEEKIAFGDNILMCITKEEYESMIKEKLKKYRINSIYEKDKNNLILFIYLKRKEILKVCNIIKKIDYNSILISEKVKYFSNMVY